MASILKVDKLDPQSGTALEIGTSGDTVTVPTGAGLTVTDEVKTNKISPATGTAFALGDSGDTFTIPSGATITNSGTATGFGGGKIGQVLQATKTDTQQLSGSASETAITGLSVAITPAATSSKILCMYTIQSASTDNSVVFLLQRGGTTIIQGAAASSRARGTTAGARIGHDSTNDPQNSSSFQYLDSPSSTSELTYTVAMQDNDAGEIDINRSMSDADSASRSRTASQLTCMEVLA